MIARFRRRPAGDDGFTLVELVVAMVVTMMVMSALIVVFLSSIRGVALSKQRQAATGIATSTMEQFRSLDYGTMSAGLYCGDLSGDAYLTISGTCGNGGTVTLAPPGTGISETLKVQTTTLPAAAVPPIYPHVTTKSLENVTYTTRAYISISPTTPSAFNLTVLVSWSSSVTRGQTKTVTERSTEFSPSRCLSSATHPYSGACQAAFNGDAGFTSTAIMISNASGSTGDITGLNGRSVQLALGSLSSTLAVEQITKLSGNVQSTSATAYGDSGNSTTGGAVATVAADSDPSSTTGGLQTATMSQGSTSTVSLSGDVGVLSAAPMGSGSGNLDAEVNSTATSCKDAANNTIIATSRPCTWGNRQSAGTSGNVSLALAHGEPNWTLASVGAMPAPARSTVAIIPGSGGTACPSASGAGCVTAQSSRSLGSISLGGMPSPGPGDTGPAGLSGSLLNLSGIVESAYSESGIGARTPSFTRTAGTLTYYDASTSSMKTLNLAALTSNTTVNLATVTGTYLEGGHTTQIQVTGSFTAGAATAGSVSAPDTTCKSQACTATATPSSTLVATLVYTITVDGAQATSFAMSVDLGACVARSSYTAAFDA